LNLKIIIAIFNLEIYLNLSKLGGMLKKEKDGTIKLFLFRIFIKKKERFFPFPFFMASIQTRFSNR